MYKRILVPSDGSPLGDRVLPYVRMLGRQLGAKVELFRVFDPRLEFFHPNLFRSEERHDASRHYREEVMTALGTSTIHLEEAGIAATAVLQRPDNVTLEGAAARGEHKEYSYGAPARLSILCSIPRKSRTR